MSIQRCPVRKRQRSSDKGKHESCWQTECQLFVQSPLPSGRDFPRIRSESRPAKLVMVVTDF
jgi:hypothetical protein